jgi:choline dehydrogenase
MQQFLQQAPLADLCRPRLAPEPEADLADVDVDVDAFINANLATYWHHAGTARMGTGAAAVVNPSLQVNGITGLLIAGASVIPRLPAVAIQGPTMLIAERAARQVRRLI